MCTVQNTDVVTKTAIYVVLETGTNRRNNNAYTEICPNFLDVFVDFHRSVRKPQPGDDQSLLLQFLKLGHDADVLRFHLSGNRASNGAVAVLTLDLSWSETSKMLKGKVIEMSSAERRDSGVLPVLLPRTLLLFPGRKCDQALVRLASMNGEGNTTYKRKTRDSLKCSDGGSAFMWVPA